MNTREKVLAGAVAGIIVLFGGVFGLKALWTKPIKEVDRKIAATREKLDKLRVERRAYFDAEEAVKKYTQHAFADQVDQASAKSGEIRARKPCCMLCV